MSGAASTTFEALPPQAAPAPSSASSLSTPEPLILGLDSCLLLHDDSEEEGYNDLPLHPPPHHQYYYDYQDDEEDDEGDHHIKVKLEQNVPPPVPPAVAAAPASRPTISARPSSSSGVVPNDHHETTVNAATALNRAKADGFDFVTTWLPTPSSESHFSGVMTRPDLLKLEAKWWRTCIVGVVSSSAPADRCGSKKLHSQLKSSLLIQSWQHQLQWAWHMNMPAVILPPLPLKKKKKRTRKQSLKIPATTGPSPDDDKQDHTATLSPLSEDSPATTATTFHQHNGHDHDHEEDANNDDDEDVYATALLRMIQLSTQQNSSSSFQFWVPVPLHPRAVALWLRIQARLAYPSNLGVLLVLQATPLRRGPAADAATYLRTQMAQQLQLIHTALGSMPIRAVGLSSRLFLINKSGYPTLSKAHQVLVTGLLRRLGRTLRWLLIHDPHHHSSPAAAAITHTHRPSLGATDCAGHVQYLQHIRQAKAEVTSVLDTTEAGLERDYLDVLQRPLQPLRDHLDFAIYENFEKDPVKYAQYQKALLQAFRDLANGETSGSTCQVLVVGAGRGPLVDSALQAYNALWSASSSSASRGAVRPDGAPRPPHLMIWAVEKNPAAVLYLQSRAQLDPLWKHYQVQVVQADLRQVTPDLLGRREPAQIIVSELLGSLGDNELSPECLDALLASPVCGPNTISIPSRYTAYLAPVSSVKLYQQAVAQALYPNETETGMLGSMVALETPYVVRPHAASQTHAEKPCWSFRHGARTSSSGGPRKGRSDQNRKTRPVLVKEREEDHDSAMMDTTGEGTSAAGHQEAMDEGEQLHAVHDLQRNPFPQNRSVVLEFGAEALGGLPYGCGYGAMDPHVAQLVPPHVTLEARPWVLTGFLGTFTAELYPTGAAASVESTTSQNCDISTRPSQFSVGMFSWFPLYFPLHTPMQVPAGATVRVHLQRFSDPERGQVWYEWSASVWTVEATSRKKILLAMSAVHNPGGRSSHVAMR